MNFDLVTRQCNYIYLPVFFVVALLSQNHHKNQCFKPFDRVILKKTDAVSLVTSAKHDSAFYKTHQMTGNTFILFIKPIVYVRLVLKLSKILFLKNLISLNFFSYRATLKQIVNIPTRGFNKLDLVLTNLAEYYENPTRTPLLGLSDHVTVRVSPKTRVKEEQSTQVKYLRDKRPSSIGRLASFYGEISWDFVINPDFTCE